MTETLFTLRDGQEKDKPYIDSYALAEGMDRMPGIEGIRVAVNGDDVPVGFLRVAIGSNGVAHIEPVVTVDTWRGYGVGKALVEDALQRHGELRLVSRGASHGFYRALGFQEPSWDAIDTSVTEDCDGCPMWDQCKPVPMAKCP